MMKRALFFLKVSRPGLWFQTLWLYLLPTAGSDVLQSQAFWLGIIYMSFPLNFLIYGWNDMVDRKVDATNPRKDSFFFGARGSKEQLASLPWPMALAQLPFILVAFLLAGWQALLLILAMIGVNALYNLPEHGLRAKPPWELLNVLGMLLLIPFSSLLNQVPNISTAAYVYLGLFCIQAHLIGEIMDIEPDIKGGRTTTAILLGAPKTKILVMIIILAEALLLTFAFKEYLLASFLFACVPWLIFDLLVLGKKPYSRLQFSIMGAGLNLSGYASMIYVWLTGGLQ